MRRSTPGHRSRFLIHEPRQERQLVVIAIMALLLALSVTPHAAAEEKPVFLDQNVDAPTRVAPAQEKNFLVNDAVDGADAPGWRFTHRPVQGLESGVADDPAVGKYFFTRTAPGTAVNTWWIQTVPVEPYATYTLRFMARGFSPDEQADHNIGVGVHFVSGDGKHLGYKGLATMGRRSAKWPSATVPDTRDWKEYDLTITPPPGTARLGIRLNLAGSPAEAGFARLHLSLLKRQSVREVLSLSPSSLPPFRAATGPVTTKGITQDVDWSLSDAFARESATRRKICLNGIWAVRPASMDGALGAGDLSDWAYIKVPGRLRCPYGANSIFYGHEQTSWKSANMAQVNAFWMWRELTLPAHDGEFAVEVGPLTGLALRLYWNDKPIGEVIDFWGGRVALPADVKPGDRGRLATFAILVPNAHKPNTYYAAADSGREKPFVAKRPARSELGDMYLLGMPLTPRFEDVRVSPSVRTKQLVLSLLPKGDIPEAAVWQVRIAEAGVGRSVVLKKTAAAAKDGNRLVLRIPWENPRLWNPEDPFLYTAMVGLRGSDGRVLDEALPVRFGFREVWVDGKELKLNGQTLRLRPRLFPGHHVLRDSESVGRYFSLARAMGFNCVWRFNYPVESETVNYDSVYDLADETGVMIVPLMPYEGLIAGQVEARNRLIESYLDNRAIRRTVNHPSVIAYTYSIQGSGTGSIPWKGSVYQHNPEFFGTEPVNSEKKIRALLGESDDARKMLSAAEFIRMMKRLAPDRPFLSHYDTGQGDGWGDFTYLNWTPLQEWEEWLRPWSQRGVMPVGSTELGLPYPPSFQNHGIPDFDFEPWVIEYAASRLGARAYELDNSVYQEEIRSSRAKYKRWGHNAPESAQPAYQAVAAEQNRRVLRTWRTYGVPMGAETFGNDMLFYRREFIKTGWPSRRCVAVSHESLKTPGIKPDYVHNPNAFPTVAPTEITEFSPDMLTPLGLAIHENNSAFLGYIAGSKKRLSAKDHVFRAGEALRKQVALVWDGFHDRRLRVTVTAHLGGKLLTEKEWTVDLPRGEIRLMPFEIALPETGTHRAEGELNLRIRDTATDGELARDRFAFQVYGPDKPVPAARPALFDPVGESGALFTTLGLTVDAVENLDALGKNPPSLLVIGRRALPALEGLDLDRFLPAGMPVLVLEQTEAVLKNAGFRVFPQRPRKFFPLPGGHPVLQGVGAPELADWSVLPTLLPEGSAPLRPNYNFRAAPYGAVASVMIEIPTRGAFTPLMQGEFDLAMTPLLETRLDDRRWVFCQLSLVDGAATEPAAARLTRNLVRWMLSAPSPTPAKPCVILAGDQRLRDLLGIETLTPDAAALPAGGVALVGDEPADPAALRAWVENGGTAVLLPLPSAESYQALIPGLNVTKTKTAMADVQALGDSALWKGIGQNDLHFRQPLDALLFDGDAILVERAAGKGAWICIGFDPRALDLDTQPYLRLTLRRQCRALSQVLANAGGVPEGPAGMLAERLRGPLYDFDIARHAQEGRLREEPADAGTDWTAAAFNDTGWEVHNLGKMQTYGVANLRVSFQLPEDAPTEGLVLDAGTVDDYDATYINGTLLGSVSPENLDDPTMGWQTRRIYPIPAKLLRPGEQNVLAMRAWNRNAETKGWKAQVRGPLVIRSASFNQAGYYAGSYKTSDDPYLHRGW